MTDRQSIIAAVTERPWAIRASTLSLIVDSLRTGDDLRAAVGAQTGPRKGGKQSSAVAVIPVYGLISQRSDFLSMLLGGTSVDQISADFRAALADPQVDAIVFEIDSPGGTIDGVPELAAQIKAARGIKPITAHANTMAASAAYWLASAADEVVVTPSGSVGSIGVFAAHQDLSKAAELEGVTTTLVSAGKYKTEGNPWEPLSEEARTNLQEQVDAFYAMFTSDVARGRGVPVETVRAAYGQGRIVLAKEALAAGMVDRVESLDATIRHVARVASMGMSARAQDTRTALLATDEGVAPEGYDIPDPTDEAPGPEPSFASRLALVSAEAADLVAYATARADMRAKGNRTLTVADRDLLRAAAESLVALADAGDRAQAPATTWVKAAAYRMALARAEHQFD